MTTLGLIVFTQFMFALGLLFCGLAMRHLIKATKANTNAILLLLAINHSRI